MLVIRPEQMEALSDYMGELFEDRMVEHLRTTFPDATQDIEEQELRSTIHGGIEKAENYEVIYEDDIRRFLEFQTTYGSQMDSEPDSRWIGDILCRQDLDGTQKIDLLDDTEMTMVRNTL